MAVLIMVFGLLNGCATSDDKDSSMLQEHHVSSQLYARMMHKEYLALADIIELSQRQVPPQFIVHYISTTSGAYHLSKADVAYLQKKGVSKEVTDFLVAAKSKDSARPYPYDPYDPYYYPHPYGYYDDGYPGVFVGGGYGGYGHHWH